MSDFSTRGDYEDYEYEEEVPRQTRASGRRGLPLWPLVVIVLLIAVVFISLWNPFAPSPEPTPVFIPTATPALPTVATFPTATPTPRRPTSTPTPALPTEITVGGYVKVVGAEAEQLSFRTGPGLDYARLKLVDDGTILKVLPAEDEDVPVEADGLTWWRLEDPAEEDEDLRIGWAADMWLEPTLP
jgi:hypothetical protein